MNKTQTLLTLFVFSFFPLHGQHSLKRDLNTPRVGDSFVKEEVPFQKVNEKSLKGTDLIWDFSDLKPIELQKEIDVVHNGKREKIREIKKEHRVSHFSRIGNNRISSENNSLDHYQLSGDSLLDSGVENQGVSIRYSIPGLIVKYPVEQGYRSESSFFGRGIHWGQSESENRGTITSLADAVGTLILPDNDTLQSVIRLHIQKKEYSRYSPVNRFTDIDRPLEDKEIKKDDELIVTDTYQWYKEGYRYPVFETIDCNRIENEEKTPLRQESYIYYPADQRFYINDQLNEKLLADKEKQKKNEKQNSKKENKRGALSDAFEISLNCYPNPVKDELHIELTSDSEQKAKIILYSIDGKEMQRIETDNENVIFETTIDMSNYEKGNYLLRVISGKKQVTEKIVKQ